MSEAGVRLVAQGDFGELVLDAVEQKNKLSIARLDALASCIRRLIDRAPTRICIRSASASIFAAGADIAELQRLDRDSARGYAQRGQDLMAMIESSPVPIDALVAGPCYGGALDLVLACRRIWAVRGTRFCHPGAGLGIMTGFGGTLRLAERVGRDLARFMLVSACAIDTDHAFEAGLVDQRFETFDQMCAAWRSSDERAH